MKERLQGVPRPRVPGTEAAGGRTRHRVSVIFLLLWLAIGALAGSTYRTYRIAQATDARILRLQELRGIIVHSDEVLTMSAAMAAATGDRHWEERYRKYEPLLQDAIDQARSLVAESYDAAAAGETDAANIALGRMEARALELVREGRIDEAQEVFSGDTYTTLKRLYSEGMHEIADQLQSASAATLQALRRSRLRQVLCLVGLLPLLLAAWWMVVRTLRRTQGRLEDARREIDGFHGSRSQFLSRMNHAIRTPLTSIMGYTDLLVDGGSLSKEQAAHLEVVRRNGQHLLELLGDLMDLADLQAGNVRIERIECSPFEIVSDVMLQKRPDAQEKGLGFEIEYRGAMPATIRTDPDRVRQILLTLVGNAIEFTEAGGVRLLLRLTQAKDRRLLGFEVVDSGVGMSAQQCREIFEAFPGRDVADTRTRGGTGLGLATSKLLAGMLGGDLVVHSGLGRGSCFMLSIDVGPLEGVEWIEDPPGARLADERPTAVRSPAPALRGRVLVAEDTPDTRLWIRSVLRQAGLEVETAEDGQVALEKAFGAIQSEQPFDLILMDMQMPVLNGYDAVAKLREQACPVSILALTSHARPGDRGACLQAGCDDYAAKPIDRAALIEKVAGLLAKTTS